MRSLVGVLIFLVGCASPVKRPGLKLPGDALKKESMLRIHQEHLEKLRTSKTAGALAQCHLGQSGQGLKRLKRVMTQQKKSAKYWSDIATCYYFNGDNYKAKVYYQLALSLQKSYAPALNNLGMLYLKQGKMLEAEKYFKQCMRWNRSLKTPLFNLGHLYLKYGRVEEAERLFLKLYSVNQEDIDILSALGSLYLMKGQVKRALSYYKRIPTPSLKREDIGLNYSIALLKNNQKQEAQKVFEQTESSIQELHQYNKKIQQILEE